MITKEWKKEEIKELLGKSDIAVRRGILTIYSLQTWDEMVDEEAKEVNGIGFNGIDAEILSSFAKQLQMKGYLSHKQMAIARKKMLKYAGQLTRVSNGEIVANVEYGIYKGN